MTCLSLALFTRLLNALYGRSCDSPLTGKGATTNYGGKSGLGDGMMKKTSTRSR